MKPHKAVVIFQDSGTHWLSPILRKGFRHCALVIQAESYWVQIDPNPDGIRLRVLAISDFDIAKYFTEQGLTAISCEILGERPLGPFSLSNCVGAVKAVLGIRKPFIITPHALYEYLRRLK